MPIVPGISSESSDSHENLRQNIFQIFEFSSESSESLNNLFPDSESLESRVKKLTYSTLGVHSLFMRNHFITNQGSKG